MSVSSGRSCSSPLSSAGSYVSGHVKLKRRWIEMAAEEVNAAKPQFRDTVEPSRKVRVTTNRDETEITCAMMQPKVVLPQDPRLWTKRDVAKWLKYMTAMYDIEILSEKFDMNGKALCMMNMDMFVNRVPIGGKFLYRDFRLRLYPAVFFQQVMKPDYSTMSPLELLTLTTGKYFP